jgi:subtilisin family serine protease
MAAPHVAGLAAMIMAYQPSYTALNVVESLKNGGEAISSLTLTTTTGKAVNAVGSLSYIKAPASVTLSKE